VQSSAEDEIRTMTLEAFADTIVPGVKRSPEDRAIAGVSDDEGAVQAGALELLETPAPGVSAGLAPLSMMLNGHASTYAAEHGIELDESVPAFVALEYRDRAALVESLIAPGHPERDGWVLLALFCNMAYDTAPHLHTGEAIENGHPGLLALGFAKPNADGLWRFPNYSYGEEFAKRHPNTTESGSPE
jgi:enediyne biosynthesis protein E8